MKLAIVAASRREQRLLIGEAKWGDKPTAHEVLADLRRRSRLMPQVEVGWQTGYVLLTRAGFSDATLRRLSSTAYAWSGWTGSSTPWCRPPETAGPGSGVGMLRHFFEVL